jgi:hypothetical protein
MKSSEILYDTESTVKKGIHFMQNAKEKMDLFGDSNGHFIVMEIEVDLIRFIC